jgi:hypothetical protein
MTVEPIRIHGLAEFRRDLRKLDRELPKALRIALNEAANIVVDDARPRIPRRTGRAAATLKAKSTGTAVRVAAGSTRAPYYPWLDWGGRVGRRKSVQRAFLKEGRYIYPSYHRNQDRFEEVLSKALTDVATQAGLDVDRG